MTNMITYEVSILFLVFISLLDIILNEISDVRVLLFKLVLKLLKGLFVSIGNLSVFVSQSLTPGFGLVRVMEFDFLLASLPLHF